MMLKVLVIISLLRYLQCLPPSSVLYQEIFRYHSETASKADFALEVVTKIHYSFHQWYFTVAFCEFTYFENRILKYTENYGYGYPVMLLNSCPNLNTSKVKPRFNKHGQTTYLVTSNELTLSGSETVIESFKRTGVFQPRSPVIFVINLPIELNSYSYYIIRLHFQLLWSRSITNSILILRSDRLRMFAYNPYHDKLYEVTDTEDIKSKVLEVQKYNMFGHKIRLSVYRTIYISDKTGPVYCDSNLVKTVIWYLNASCIPVQPRDGSTVGDLLENGTATGVTADLLDGYTDIELSSRILKTSYYGYIDTTYPLFNDDLCFVVKNSDKQSAFLTIIKLLSYEVFTVFMITIIIFIVIAIIFKIYEKDIIEIDDKQSIGSTILDLIKCLIRQTVIIHFPGMGYRTFVLLIMIYSLIVDCAIDVSNVKYLYHITFHDFIGHLICFSLQGIITSAITYPRYKADINTMSELAHTNLSIAVHNRDFVLFNKSLNTEHYDLLKDRIVIFNDKKIKDFFDKRQFEYATLLRKSHALKIIKKPKNMKNGRSLFHIMGDCPVPSFIVYGLRYGSPYLPRINKFLFHLMEGGILQYWNEAESYTLYRKNLVKVNKERKPLNNSSLIEVYMVLLFGLLVSVVSFIIEILWHSFKQFRTPY